MCVFPFSLPLFRRALMFALFVADRYCALFCARNQLGNCRLTHTIDTANRYVFCHTVSLCKGIASGLSEMESWRRGWDSNPRMEVLQTSPLGLLGTAPEPVSISKSDGVCQLRGQSTRT
jgi:hypothetical protein